MRLKSDNVSGMGQGSGAIGRSDQNTHSTATVLISPNDAEMVDKKSYEEGGEEEGWVERRREE